MSYILSVNGIKKSFGGVRALKGITLNIKKGEVHCLAGENGCGKSTIIKIISGFYKADEGTIEIDGKSVSNLTPADAIKAGIQVIYQDFSIFPNLTVAENLAFNKLLADKKTMFNKAEAKKIASEAISKINFNIDLDAIVEDLSVSDKQLIAISRSLLDDAKLIIMDEPTTALTKKEVTRLFEIVKDLKSKGITIVFVSHKLEEVFDISDSITILRSGENVISCPIEEMTEDKFAFYMTGREIDTSIKSKVPKEFTEKYLEVKDLTASGFKDISFDLHKGEILGISGQLGSGRTELSLALFGLNKPSKGEIKIQGNVETIENVAKAQQLKIALVPEDRLTEGLFLEHSIIKNTIVAKIQKLANKFGIIKWDNLDKEARKWVEELGVATKDPTLPVKTLSGGNQQKVVLGKWLSDAPEVLILNGPTVGVDIGAKYDIHNLLINLASKGMSIIVVSYDSSEILSLCDTVLVMQGGKIVKTLKGEEITIDSLNKATI
ncbi:lipase [Candidatus Epulonipiscium fishelsonii]|uniref:Lipase n=1 Tax=Candidatus Epulonipiscium fishelsonii TaxID=77094 RepID=A0ACC8XF32_9FIRM|nr:lipase [Epulopiscium sp. SCG-B05WGA-EpuloA1]ONI41897.1 lipase [Epulopiscium sp. SCG-B11WGA-EpuloA1]